MQTDYQRIAIEGAFRLDPGVRTLDELRERTEAAMQRAPVAPFAEVADIFRRAAPVMPRTAPPALDEIVISRELCKEILVALDHAAGFGAFVPRRIQNESVAEYAGSMRFDALNAAMRLRRAALSQEVCA